MPIEKKGTRNSDLIASIANGTAINDGAITPKKVSFIMEGINKFNPATMTTGYWVNQTTGAVEANSTYNVSDYISALPSTQYSLVADVNLRVAYYNSSKVFISGVVNPAIPITSPSLTAYVRFSFNKALLSTQMFVEAVALPPYEGYQQFIASSYIPITPFIENKMIVKGVVNSDNTDFIAVGKNLFDSASATTGYFVNQTTGSLDAAETYAASDYIRIVPGTQYAFVAHASLRLCFYNVNKKYIAGYLNPASPITAPATAFFVRYSFLLSSIATQQFELGTTPTAYESFRYKLTRNLEALRVFEGIAIDVLLPPFIPAVVGHEVNIYFANIINVENLSDYQIDVVCTKGKQQIERWTYIPVAEDVGTVTLTINVYKNNTICGTATSTIKIVATTAGSGLTKRLLIIGDSTTASSWNVPVLQTLFSTDALTVNFVGTQGSAPAQHEGRSGWTANMHYTNVASSFVFSGAFNFATYLATNSLTAPDIVILNLGINDVFTETDDIAVTVAINLLVSRYDSMIANIKLSNANTIFGIAVTIPSGSQDAFASYNSGMTSWRYNRSNKMLVKKIKEYYANKEINNIYLLPLNVCLDTVNNAQLAETAPINSRNPTNIARATNGVHPGEYGYYQIVDMQYYWVKSIV